VGDVDEPVGLTSDADLRAATVGPLEPHDAPIDLHDYDPRWPQLFAAERDRLRAALGDTALLIEHVGSTSVPGVSAKPIIDIVLAVPDSADEPAYLPWLIAAGYVLRIREPKWFEHRLFERPDPKVHVHVFSAGAPEIDRMIRFRDRLRSDAADREQYARAKRELAARTWRHVQHYADAKTTVIDDIMSRAGQAPT
jgi:GrpB-like predicted nucleotidyltransferase (UPF0157 family)